MRRNTPIYILVSLLWTVSPLSAQKLSDFLSEARRGDAVAQYNAALCYRHGWGTAPSLSNWHRMMRSSAEGGQMEAREALVEYYRNFAPEFADYWSQKTNTIPFDYHYRSYDEGCYYGEMRGGTRNGYGSFVWDSGTYHIGGWEEGERYGMGYTRFEGVDMYCYLADEALGLGAIVVTDPTLRLAGGEDAVCYVGYIENGLPEGVGTLYDTSGEVCYYGTFRNGFPTTPHSTPAARVSNLYRWNHEELGSGDSWEGECYNGVRHGFGIYRWEDGSWWCGFWEDGVREGAGLYVRNDGAIMSGTWSNGQLLH